MPWCYDRSGQVEERRSRASGRHNERPPRDGFEELGSFPGADKIRSIRLVQSARRLGEDATPVSLGAVSQVPVCRYVCAVNNYFCFANYRPDLYGKLVTEWLSAEKGADENGDIDMSESFEELPGAKRLEARSEWEKVVFIPMDIDVEALQEYLESLFITGNKDAAKAILNLRDEAQEFESTLGKPKQFSVSNLRWVIDGLQKSDLLSNEKREVLKDFLSNDIILGEVRNSRGFRRRNS